MRIRLSVLTVLLLLASASPAYAVPLASGCKTTTAPRLCTVLRYHAQTNRLRHRLGQPRIALSPAIVIYPGRRVFAEWTWYTLRGRARLAYRAAPWLHDPFLSQAMCIHRWESIDWHDSGSPGGGMQFLDSTWLNGVVRGYQFAPLPGLASPSEQLRAAYRLVSHDGGWHEWSTHGLCGL